MGDEGKGFAMVLGGLIVAVVAAPVLIYDHVRTKNKYYSLGKADGYAEATIACELKYRKLADKILAIKDNQEKLNREKNALIEKLLKEIEDLKEEIEDLKKEKGQMTKQVAKKKKERCACLNGAIKNFNLTINRLRAA